MRFKRILVLSIAAFILAPSGRSQQTNVLTIYGEVLKSDGVTYVRDGFGVTVVNLSKGDTLSSLTGESEPGKYNVVFIDFMGNEAASLGDSIEVTLRAPDGRLIATPILRVVTSEDLSGKRLRQDIQMGSAGVLVAAPEAQVGGPGEECEFLFKVVNLGEFEDIFDVSLTHSHSDWPVSFPEVAGPLSVGDTADVNVVILVPDTLPNSTFEYVTLKACSQTDTSVCGEDMTYRTVPATIQSRSVAFARDHIEVSWELSNDALGIPFSLLKTRGGSAHTEKIQASLIERRGRAFHFHDYDIEIGGRYSYSLKLSGEETHTYLLGSASVPPRGFLLYQNYPNPFKPKTVIKFEIPERTRVSLKVFDVGGRLVRTLIDGVNLDADTYEVEWDGTDDLGREVSSGIYFCTLKVRRQARIRKMILLR